MGAVKNKVNCIITEYSTMKLIQKFERGKLGNSSFKAESLTISKNCLIFLIPHLKSKQVSPIEKNFEDY